MKKYTADESSKKCAGNEKYNKRRGAPGEAITRWRDGPEQQRPKRNMSPLRKKKRRKEGRAKLQVKQIKQSGGWGGKEQVAALKNEIGQKSGSPWGTGNLTTTNNRHRQLHITYKLKMDVGLEAMWCDSYDER